jgi:hypothetical protein
MAAATWLRRLWAHRKQSIHGGQASRLVKGPEKRQVPGPVLADPRDEIAAFSGPMKLGPLTGLPQRQSKSSTRFAFDAAF